MSNLLSVCDIKDEVLDILELAKNFKEGKMEEKPLAGKSLAMIFQKSSTRTRVSFDVGMYQLGGQALFLSSSELQMGRGEPIPDTAKVLSRFVDGIMIRAIEHDDVVDDLFMTVKKEIIEIIHNRPDDGDQATDLLMVAKYFERIGDHATNIAEWVIFSITGER